MNTTTNPSSMGGPLTEEQLVEVSLARGRAKKIRKAAGVATFNAWASGIVAALSAPFALTSITGLLLCVGFSLIAYNEFRGRNGLLRYEPSAATLLGWNQVGLLAVIVVYSLWMLHVSLSGPNPIAAELDANPELGALMGSFDGLEDLYRQIAILLYGSIILFSAVFQGLNAYYYFTRRKHVEAYVRETPAWVIELQRAHGGG